MCLMVRNNSRLSRRAPPTARASRNDGKRGWFAGRSHLFTKFIQIRAAALRRRVRHLAVVLAVPALAWAQGLARAQAPRVALTVKPVLCITDSREESCELSILVMWRSDAAGRYCLHNDFAAQPIRCWQLASSGMVVEERVVDATFRYWLTNGDTDARLAEATLDVMSTETDDRRRQRRRRHVWDIL